MTPVLAMGAALGAVLLLPAAGGGAPHGPAVAGAAVAAHAGAVRDLHIARAGAVRDLHVDYAGAVRDLHIAHGAAHDLHIAYADFAVEGAVVAGRVRLFKDDLERALGPLVGASSLALAPGPEADALVLRYVREHLTLEVEGHELEPRLLQSGQDELDREPVWFVVVEYRAAETLQELVIRNTLLFDVFDDQRNVLKVVHFPDGAARTFYFAVGEAEQRVAFD